MVIQFRFWNGFIWKRKIRLIFVFFLFYILWISLEFGNIFRFNGKFLILTINKIFQIENLNIIRHKYSVRAFILNVILRYLFINWLIMFLIVFVHFLTSFEEICIWFYWTFKETLISCITILVPSILFSCDISSSSRKQGEKLDS